MNDLARLELDLQKIRSKKLHKSRPSYSLTLADSDADSSKLGAGAINLSSAATVSRLVLKKAWDLGND